MKLGRYELSAELARGGMGIIWLASARGIGGFRKPVVVKELLPQHASDEHYRSMFLDEARLAARLSHKNIVQTLDLGEENGRLFMALELLEGATLRRVVTLLGKKRLRPALAARIVCEVLAGLDYAHRLKDDDGGSLGIVHRDVTPANVFLCFDGQVKLIDFGIARSRAHEVKTREGFVKGTAAYMSPDHVSPRPIDPRADVFVAGILLRELLLGERLWGEDADDASILRCLLIGHVPELPERDDVPAELRAICIRAMAPSREDRFFTAEEMRVALEAWLVENDSGGSLAELARLFAGDLGFEVARVRMQHKQTAVEEEEPKLAEQPATASPTAPALERRTPRAARFALVMAVVATIAASVSVASAVLDDDGREAVIEVEP